MQWPMFDHLDRDAAERSARQERYVSAARSWKDSTDPSFEEQGRPAPRRGPMRAASSGLLVVLVNGLSVAPAGRGPLRGGPPTQATLAVIPPDHLSLIQQVAADASCHLSWTVLAAIADTDSASAPTRPRRRRPPSATPGSCPPRRGTGLSLRRTCAPPRGESADRNADRLARMDVTHRPR